MADRLEITESVSPAGEAIHLPGPSYLPAIVALGISIAVVGVVLNWFVCGAGLAIALIAIVRWVRQMRADIADLPLERH